MKRTTTTEIKNLILQGTAKSIEKIPTADFKALRPIEKLKFSRNAAGINGLLFYGADGQLYGINGRNSALFYFL